MKIFRFAPSPTGFLHVGGARTAIFNWLLAKSENGKFLLRIEDTDQQRSSKEFIEQIKESLNWLGVFWDDKPVFQSRQIERHKQTVQFLLDKKKAYRCFCTSEELKIKKEKAEKLKRDYVYDKKCRYLSDEEIENNIKNSKKFTIRIKTEEGKLHYQDKIMGDISTEEKLIGDFILLRSDGTPVYQLAVVVDDHNMKITDIVRGADHLANTLKQILIFKAMNWNVPEYAHVPLILGPDKRRLSKRHGSAAVEDFMKRGFLPEALFNYLCLLGWSPGDDKEIFSIDEMIAQFSLRNVNKSNAIFDEKKLTWMNAKYISDLDSGELLELSKEFENKKANITPEEYGSLIKLADLVKIRSETVNDFDQRMSFYYTDPLWYNKKGVKKYFDDTGLEYLLLLLEEFQLKKELFADKNEEVIRKIAEKLNVSAAKFIHPLRLALTGDIASPGIFDIIEILGKEKVIRRIQNAIAYIRFNNKI